MNSCIITNKQRNCLLSFNFPFPVPYDLSTLSKEKLITIVKAIDADGLEFIDDEPTEKCLMCESIIDNIQDNLFPDIYDLISQ